MEFDQKSIFKFYKFFINFQFLEKNSRENILFDMDKYWNECKGIRHLALPNIKESFDTFERLNTYDSETKKILDEVFNHYFN